jgi:hypothetical protein
MPEQLHARVRYHFKRDQVIIMQRNDAEGIRVIIRQSVDSEIHSHFHFKLLRNSTSATDLQGSMPHLKELMDTYYDHRPATSSVVVCTVYNGMVK